MTKLQEKGEKPKPILVLYLCGGSRTRIRVFAKPASLGLASSRTGMLLGYLTMQQSSRSTWDAYGHLQTHTAVFVDWRPSRVLAGSGGCYSLMAQDMLGTCWVPPKGLYGGQQRRQSTTWLHRVGEFSLP